MKLHINRVPISGPWGGGNLWVKAMYAQATQLGHQIVDITDDPDVIVIAGVQSENGGLSADHAISYKFQRPKTKLVIRVNENDARKGTNDVDSTLIRISRYVDGTIFVSRWLEDYFAKRSWACTNNVVIINGVDRDHFKPQPKLDDGRIHLVTHHWSNNWLKGFDVYSELDHFVRKNKEFTFTYIGRSALNFSSSRVIAPLFGQALGDELGRYDVYVSASRFDPGPNHILEALSCELPTYVHRDGGGAVEFAGPDHTFRDSSDLLTILGSRQFKNNSSQLIDWSSCVENYVSFLEKT